MYHPNAPYSGYSNNANFQYSGNDEDSYPSQVGYPHHSQSSAPDGQDSQGVPRTVRPYYHFTSQLQPPLILDAYQQSGGTQNGSSHPQDWYTQQYGSTGSDHTMYNHSQAHEFREVNTTSTRDIEPYVKERMDQGQKKFFCGWVGCTHTGRFVRKAQLQTHIKSVHLSEKPFVCTACNASFTRRQDAARHVDTMNSGKQFKCHFCDDGFARKDYRDRHCERCKNNKFR